MPTFVPLVKPRSLPPLGQAIEHAVMDWKARPTTTPFEKAQDVAAFANHLGGTLLIGAQEHDGQLRAYVGLTIRDASDSRDEFSKAVAQRCVPLPRIDFEEYEHPDDASKRIVAVNVWPSLNLIGVKVAAHRTEGYAGESFVFPVRSGTDTLRLDPTQIPMYMTPEVRRTVVLLSQIPHTSPVRIIEETYSSTRIVEKVIHERDLRFDAVIEDQNIVRFFNPSTSGRAPVHLPLDRISTVYQDEQQLWRVLVQLYR